MGVISAPMLQWLSMHELVLNAHQQPSKLQPTINQLRRLTIGFQTPDYRPGGDQCLGRQIDAG